MCPATLNETMNEYKTNQHRKGADHSAVQILRCGASCLDWLVSCHVDQAQHHHPSICGSHSYHGQRIPLAEEHTHGLCTQGEIHARLNHLANACNPLVCCKQQRQLATRLLVNGLHALA